MQTEHCILLRGRAQEAEALAALTTVCGGLSGCTLRSLDLSDNALGEKGVRAVAAALRSQPALQVPPSCHQLHAPPSCHQLHAPPSCHQLHAPPSCHQLHAPPSCHQLQVPPSCHQLHAPPSCHQLHAPPSCHQLHAPPSCHQLHAPPSCHQLQAPPSCHQLHAPPSCHQLHARYFSTTLFSASLPHVDRGQEKLLVSTVMGFRRYQVEPFTPA
jgi:hypothetical protein